MQRSHSVTHEQTYMCVLQRQQRKGPVLGKRTIPVEVNGSLFPFPPHIPSASEEAHYAQLQLAELKPDTCL